MIGALSAGVSSAKLDRIRAEVDALSLSPVPVGAGRARGDGTRQGWISGLSLTRLVDPGRFNRLIELPATASAIGALMRARGADRVHQVIVNRLDPGGELNVHRDGRPFEPPPERWHLPVISNPSVEYWDESLSDDTLGDGAVHMSVGSWWGPVPYWLLHSMVNRGGEPRVHLIVDLVVEAEE